MARLRRGKWGTVGLSSVGVGRLMGISSSRAKQYLYGLRDYLGRMPTDPELLDMMYEYKKKKEYAKIKKYLA